MDEDMDKKYNSELLHKINAHIRKCSEDQRKKEVSTFDEMCNKFLKFSKGENND